MKKTQCQPNVSTIHPPSNGPTKAEIAQAVLFNAIIFARSSKSNKSAIIVNVRGITAPAPTP